MKLSKYIFRSRLSHRLAFAPVDPLGDGLGELIRREQQSPHAIDLEDDSYDLSLWNEM